jgi:hypothetical protein
VVGRGARHRRPSSVRQYSAECPGVKLVPRLRAAVRLRPQPIVRQDLSLIRRGVARVPLVRGRRTSRVDPRQGACRNHLRSGQARVTTCRMGRARSGDAPVPGVRDWTAAPVGFPAPPLFRTADLEHLGTTDLAGAFSGGSPILHRHLFWIRNFALHLALHAVARHRCRCHGGSTSSEHSCYHHSKLSANTLPDTGAFERIRRVSGRC